MERTDVETLLYDINPSRLRLRQVEYLLTGLATTGANPQYPVTNLEREGRSYDTSDPTFRAVERHEERIQRLADEAKMLIRKLQVYEEWLSLLDAESNSMIEYVYIQNNTVSKYCQEHFMPRTTYYRKIERALNILAENPISVETTVA